MRKRLLFTILCTAIIVPTSVFGQSKASSKKNTKPAAVPVIKTANDSTSYVLGQQMVMGLSQYLVQLGVLTDTAFIKNEYQPKIAIADALGKVKLEKELKLKIDSVSKANEQNRALFLKGFDEALNADSKMAAYYAGIAIVPQIKGMMSSASAQVLGDADLLNKDLFLSGFKCDFLGDKPLITVANGQEFIQQKEAVIAQAKENKDAESMKVEYAQKIADQQAFMEANKMKPGVVVTPSGLQYKIDKAGNGPQPQMNEKVTVHYKGMLLDGTVFDSSYDRGEPASFAVGQLIKGFNEALLLMPEGSKWTVYIPYDLAYGTVDRGGPIKPYSDLIFEIELIKVAE